MSLFHGYSVLARRMKRLLPVLLFCLTIVCLISSCILLGCAANLTLSQQRAKMKQAQQEAVFTEAVALLKAQEGFRASLYNCAAGVKTIGYGNTTYIKQNPKFKSITIEVATKLLENDVRDLQQLLVTYEASTAKKVLTTMNYTEALSSEQQVALISLMYNIGEVKFKQSSLKKYIDLRIQTLLQLEDNLSEKDLRKVKKRIRVLSKFIELEFLKWSKVKQGTTYITSPGLLKRRKLESRLFNDPQDLLT